MPPAARGLRPGPPPASACRHRSKPPARGRSVRTRPPSQRARERAAIEQDVLTGDEAGLVGAEESAREAKLLGIAEAAGRVLLGAFRQPRLVRDATLLRLGLGGVAQAVGEEWSRQQAVDGDVVDDGLARKSGDEAGEARARAV